MKRNKPEFRAEIVETKGIEYFKAYHNAESDQAQVMTINPVKAEIMINTLQNYINNKKEA
ncbi:MAG: hypothetical protein DRH97_00030 [Chloroflexi bacterium]|nr:MAG: hypothetical protein DRH97_00030 [Chloroflexota bacterium]